MPKILFVLNRILSFVELARQNIYQFKTRINNSANCILHTVEKYIRDSSVCKHCLGEFPVQLLVISVPMYMDHLSDLRYLNSRSDIKY